MEKRADNAKYTKLKWLLYTSSAIYYETNFYTT